MIRKIGDNTFEIKNKDMNTVGVIVKDGKYVFWPEACRRPLCEEITFEIYTALNELNGGP